MNVTMDRARAIEIIAAYGADDHVFAGQHGLSRFANLLEEGFDVFLAEVQPVEAVHGIQVDGDRQELAVDVGEGAVLVGAPLREL